jgi:1-acyl-sn-glycerol-3-phosphate acyltransferase
MPRPHPLVAAIVRGLVMPVLARRARLSAEGIASIASVSPPFIVVANHVSFWDPFWVAAFLRHDVQFVASDNLFRTAFLRAVMRLLGAIPKTKLMNDSETVRHVVDVLRGGGAVGIFPEGARSDDGRTSDLVPAVSRLIRRLRVPVIGARITGGYLTKPRWARHTRRGAVKITYDLLVPRDAPDGLTEADVHDAIIRHIQADDLARQRACRVAFRGRRLAEHLERLLFICPNCRSVSRLVSCDDRLRCTACEYAVRMTESGLLEPCTGPLHFDSPADWNAWQLPVFEAMLQAPGAFQELIFEERPARLLVGYRARPLRCLDRGTARLTRERILFRSESGRSEGFLLAGVQGMNVQNGEKLEFYSDHALYRLDFTDPRASPYKWRKAVEMLAAANAQVSSLIRVNTY